MSFTTCRKSAPTAASAIDQFPPWLNRALACGTLAVLAIYVAWVWRTPRVVGRLEHLGGELWGKLILSLRKGGRIVTCGATAGFEVKTDLRHVFFRQLEILGSTMGPKGDLFPILSHVAAGRLKPVDDCVMPLRDAQAAHRRLEQRAQFGKIILVNQ